MINQEAWPRFMGAVGHVMISLLLLNKFFVTLIVRFPHPNLNTVNTAG